MGIKSDLAILHTAERLIANHRAAVEECQPLLNLARAYFGDGDGVVSHSEIAAALRSELAILAERHGHIRTAIADVESVLPQEK